VAVASILVAAATVAGCSGGSGAPSAPATSSPTPSPSRSGADRALASLVLSSRSASQAGLPVQERPAPDGTALRGKNAHTLDLCNAHFPSEAKRTARDQVDYGPSKSATFASEEVVRYSGDGAVAAYDQVQRAARTCPTSVKEGSATVTNVTVQPRNSALVASQLTVTQQLTSQGQKFWTVAVYQYDGNIFVGIYTYLPTRVEALQYADALAGLVAKRLNVSVGTPVSLVLMRARLP
jgi:hypothetical protein